MLESHALVTPRGGHPIPGPGTGSSGGLEWTSQPPLQQRTQAFLVRVSWELVSGTHLTLGSAFLGNLLFPCGCQCDFSLRTGGQCWANWTDAQRGRDTAVGAPVQRAWSSSCAKPCYDPYKHCAHTDNKKSMALSIIR